MIYLDSSAIVKLVRLEGRTRALIAYLKDSDEFVTSVISTVEVHRAVRRVKARPRVHQRAEKVLDRFGLVEVDASIRAVAVKLEPTGLRALDAIHVATALDLGADVSALVTYDGRQAEAARLAGIHVDSPGA